MAHYENTLTIDLGEIGSRHSKPNFRVQLNATPLTELIRQAGEAYWVYELFLVRRPSDVWRYVWVEQSHHRFQA